MAWFSAGCQSIWPFRSTSAPPPSAAPATETNANHITWLPTFHKKSEPPAVVLKPRMELEWNLAENTTKPGSGMNGHSIVGPDGTLELGPYGVVHVASLTLPQAQAAVEKQVRQFVTNPKVVLRVVSMNAPSAAPTVRPVVHQWSSDDEDDLPIIPTAYHPETELPTVPVLPPLTTPGAPAALPDVAPPTPTAEVVQASRRQRMPLAVHGDAPGLPREGNRVTLPPYQIGPPDILQIASLEGLGTHPIDGPHLIRPDGTVALGAYGSAYVAGMTLDQAKEAIAQVIHSRLEKSKKTLKDVIDGLSVDVLAYNSKVYYVITDGGGFGEQVTRFPVTGNETVLDAISLNTVGRGLTGLPAVASRRHIWVARPGPDGKDHVLPVDWIGISQRGQSATNYQLLPGDRVYVKADKWRTFGATVDKIVSPFERMLGVTLLGSETVNSIKLGTIP
jgi:polysaccharide export outer membrane protein